LKEPTKGPARKASKSRNPVREAKAAEKKAKAAAAARGEIVRLPSAACNRRGMNLIWSTHGTQLGSGAAQTNQRNNAAGGYGMLWALGADTDLFAKAKAKAQAKAAVRLTSEH